MEMKFKARVSSIRRDKLLSPDTAGHRLREASIFQCLFPSRYS